MRVSIRSFLWIAVLGLMFLIAPATGLAQGRGRGRGPDVSKKCGKFVNCHDARDGRWDGRGPRGYSWRRGIFVGRGRDHRRWRRFDHSRFVRVHNFHRIRSDEDRFNRRRFRRIR